MTILMAEVDNRSDWCRHEVRMTLCVLCGDVLAIADEDMTVETSTSNKTVYEDIGHWPTSEEEE